MLSPLLLYILIFIVLRLPSLCLFLVLHLILSSNIYFTEVSPFLKSDFEMSFFELNLVQNL
jgi:hypothetical protein